MSDSPPPPYSEQDKHPNYPTKAPPVPEPPILAPIQTAGVTAAPPYPEAPRNGGTHVIQLQPIVIQTPLFGQFPVETDCRYCHAHIVTHTNKVAGALPWVIMGICFVLGFFLLIPWCICCLPFCIESCLDVLHTCPSCKRALGRFSRI
uniref:LITAF domain-containing protein n=1 Tax=Panagrellus redivivus TaxID=6233 RepID=A0A7E4UP50_PANRE